MKVKKTCVLSFIDVCVSYIKVQVAAGGGGGGVRSEEHTSVVI